MTNIEIYKKAFMETFDLLEERLNDQLIYQSIESWDSVGHMTLIAELEDAYDIMLETDDIIDFSSFEKGKEILLKYGVKM